MTVCCDEGDSMSPTIWRVLSRFAVLLAICMTFGCEPPPSDSADRAATAPSQTTAQPALWRQVQGATVVAVSDPAVERQLERATGEARRTLDDARQRWSVATPEQRMLWGVKWAAPLAEAAGDQNQASPPPAAGSESVEHIWIRPLTWSAFRIEGVLLSTPTRALDCGRTASEIVSFPIDEVSDWIHFASQQADTAFEGGFTVRVLQERYGNVGD